MGLQVGFGGLRFEVPGSRYLAFPQGEGASKINIKVLWLVGVAGLLRLESMGGLGFRAAFKVQASGCA